MKKRGVPKPISKAVYSFLVTAVAIFLAEGLVMLLLHHEAVFAAYFSPRTVGIFDALVVTFLTFPTLYIFSFRPLLLEIKKRRRAEGLKDELLAVLSHELRTPVTVIQEGISLLADSSFKVSAPPDQKALLDTVASNVKRLDTLFGKAMVATQILADELQFVFQPMDAAEVLEGLETLFKPTAQSKGVVLRFTGGEQPMPCVGDAKRLGEALGYLVENSIQATDSGGTVTLSCVPAPAGVEFTVEDSGKGIAAEDLALLFDRFSWVGGINERKTGGLGLGLFISKAIIERHGGTIAVSSVVGQGTRMRIKIHDL